MIMEQIHKNKNILTVDMAYRLRFKRGLRLPLNCVFEHLGVGDIAREQHELFEEIKKLDELLEEMWLEQQLESND